jgi:hypothetical protein
VESETPILLNRPWYLGTGPAPNPRAEHKRCTGANVGFLLVSGGAIKWSPTPRVTASTGVSLTGGSVSQVTAGSDTFLRIAYSGESVASGSFANTGGGRLTVTSIYDMAGLSAPCAGGPLTAIAFRGSITLKSA